MGNPINTIKESILSVLKSSINKIIDLLVLAFSSELKESPGLKE
jgi:hypothetical protein